MENNQTYTQQQNGVQENENAISIKDIVFIVLNNWFWFALSAIICLVISGFIYKSKPKVYTGSATILVRDDNKGGGMRSQSMDAIFANMGFDNSSLSLENEIHIIRSTPLLMKTADRLGLNSWCSRNSLFHKISYYKDAPMRLTVFNQEVDSVSLSISLEVTPIDANSFEYQVMSINGAKFKKEEKKKAVFNQIVNVNEYVSFAIDKTKSFGKKDVKVTYNMGYSPLYGIASSMKGRLSVSRVEIVRGRGAAAQPLGRDDGRAGDQG